MRTPSRRNDIRVHVGRGLRVAAVTVVAALTAGCGGAEPPPPVEGAIVGKVLVQADTTLEFLGGPDPVTDTQVIVVGVESLREWWEASPAGETEEYGHERVLRGEFATSAEAVDQADGWRVDVDDRGAFRVDVPDGDVVLCHTYGAGGEPIRVGPCHELVMEDQARVIVWTGAAYELDVFE